jgi:hypothetical protein
MSRFFIVNTVAWGGARNAREHELTYGDRAGQCTGCAWLFTASAGVDDVEAALREAVLDHFASGAGRRLRETEALTPLTWEEAIPWVPDEVWRRHGLTALRHPEVERVLLDEEEDLAEELEPAAPLADTPRVEAPLPTP